MRSLNITRDHLSKGVGFITGGTLATLGVIKAVGMTTVIAGAAPVVGAIKTTTVLTSAGPVVLSLVKASLAAKLVYGLFCIAGATVIGYVIYSAVDSFFNEKDLDSIKTGAANLKNSLKNSL